MPKGHEVEARAVAMTGRDGTGYQARCQTCPWRGPTRTGQGASRLSVDDAWEHNQSTRKPPDTTDTSGSGQ